MRILVIDPETNRQRQLRTILASIGHRSADIEIANDEKTANKAVKKKKYECVFLVLASNFNGIDFLKTVMAPGSPVILVLAEPSRENVIKAKEAGLSSILAYPFSVNDVENAMQQLFKNIQN